MNVATSHEGRYLLPIKSISQLSELVAPAIQPPNAAWFITITDDYLSGIKKTLRRISSRLDNSCALIFSGWK
jgi:hypothetical protein